MSSTLRTLLGFAAGAALVLTAPACSDDAAADDDATSSSSSSSSSGAASSSGDNNTSSSSGGSSSGGSSSSSGEPDAGPTCTAEEQAAATAALTEAEAWATDFNEGEACESEHFPADIAQRTYEAIQACADARGELQGGEGAAEIREALTGTITLGLLQGRTFAESLVGATIWGAGQGVYGAPYAVHFEAATATTTECSLNDADEWTCEDIEGTYTLSEDDDGNPVLELSFGGATITPSTLTAVPDDFYDAPAFVFEADGDGIDAYTFEDICSA